MCIIMNFKIHTVTIFTVMSLIILEELSCKPLPLHEDAIKSPNGTFQVRRSLVRRKRSIPEVDAVNPAYQWGVERVAEEDPANQPALSPFNDLGALINFGERKSPPARRSQQRPLSRVSSGVGLSADEQYECYRQQNIDPPASSGEERRVEYADAPRRYAPARNADRARSREIAGDVYSLYSDSQKASRPKSDHDWRVYRPVGVQPEFPVYDDDVDAHMMDPLQGILDDKYWLEPEVREATVRRYIDLAAANMMPPPEQMPLVKREVDKSQEKKNEKSPLKGGERNCPCQEVVVACGSCGKGKKSNSTGEDVAVEGVSYGRKLLWLAVDNAKGQEDVDDYAADDQFKISQLDESIPHYVGRKLLSLEEDDGAEYGGDEEVSWIEDSIHSVSNYSGKDEESNGVQGDKLEDKINFQSDGGLESLEEDRISMSKNYFDRDDFQGSMKGDKNKKHYPDYSKNDSSTLIEPGDGVEQERDSIQDFTPGLYKPNKIANVLQKAMQKKPIATQMTTTINSNREFQKVNDELFANISKYKNTETVGSTTKPVTIPRTDPSSSGTEPNASQNKAKAAQLSEENKTWPNKKRSLPFASINENVGSPDELFDKFAYAEGDLPLFQGEQAQDAGGSANKGASTSNDATTQGAPTSAEVKYTVSSISPTLYLTGTATAATSASLRSTKGKKMGTGDEEAVDAEVANDIVDTVVAESQHGSVLGHRLGVCRRNESLMNIRYGRVVPEMEKVIKTVTGCIMDRLKAHLASQSCVLLETDLSEFLKWTVLAGEPYKDYVQKTGEFNFLPTVPPTPDPKCREPLAAMEPATELPEPMPPNPRMFAEQSAEKLAA